MSLQHEVAEIRTLLEERLRIKGRNLEQQLRRAGRLLPRAIRRDAEFLAHANQLMQNPKLVRMIDPSQAEKAHHKVVNHLRSVDPVKRRTDRLVNLTAVVALNLLIVGAVTVSVLVWQGFI